jgi:hypothetical protein
VGLGLLARDLKPKILQHPPIDPVGGPVDLPAHHPLAVGRWAAPGRFHVAQVSSSPIELTSEGLTRPLLDDPRSQVITTVNDVPEASPLRAALSV